MSRFPNLHIASLLLLWLLVTVIPVMRPLAVALEPEQEVPCALSGEICADREGEGGEQCADETTAHRSQTCHDCATECGGLCACCFSQLPPGAPAMASPRSPDRPVRYAEPPSMMLDVAPRDIEHPPC